MKITWGNPPKNKPSYCTGFPSTSLNDCCKQHDLDYASGTVKSRWKADWDFHKCIRAKGFWFRAWTWWLAVRIFGRRYYRS